MAGWSGVLRRAAQTRPPSRILVGELYWSTEQPTKCTQLKQCKRELLDYDDHCTVVIVMVVPPFCTFVKCVHVVGCSVRGVRAPRQHLHEPALGRSHPCMESRTHTHAPPRKSVSGQPSAEGITSASQSLFAGASEGIIGHQGASGCGRLQYSLSFPRRGS